MTTFFRRPRFMGSDNRRFDTSRPSLWRSHASRITALMLGLLTLSQVGVAQDIACNVETSLSGAGYTATSTTVSAPSTLSSLGNITDGNVTTSAALNLTSSANKPTITSSCTQTNASVTINVAIPQTTQTVPNYIGFIVNNDLGEFEAKSVSITSGGTAIDPKSLIVTNIGGGRYRVGIVTSANVTFDGIRLSLTNNAPACPITFGNPTNSATVNIYDVFRVKYCDVSALPANTPTAINYPDRNVTVSSSGFIQVGPVIVGVVDEANAISSSATDFARIVPVLAAFLSVKDNSTVYPAGTYAGFSISNAALANVGLLSDLRVEVRRNNVVVDFSEGGGLLLSAQLLSGPNRYTVGFTSEFEFDEIRLVFSGVNVGETQVYSAIVQRFAEGPTPDCNTPTQLTAPIYPITVDNTNTGIVGTACLDCSLTDRDNIVNSNADDFATLSLPVAAAQASISVKKNGVPYGPGTFAGFSIGNSSLVGLNLFSSLRIVTYLGGQEQDSETGTSGLVNLGALNASRQVIGFVTENPFDEIRLIVTSPGADLGTTFIYGPVITTFCDDTALECNTATNLTNPAYSVYVNAANTAINSAVCLNCSISNTQAVVDPTSPDDFATINLVAVGNQAGFSVRNAITDYVPGTFAGFDISTGSLLNVDALSSIRIRTYNNGTETPTSASGTGYSGTRLLAGVGLFTLSGRQTIGAVSEEAFDEVKIEFTSLATVPLGEIRIYNAVIQRLCNENPIACGTTALLTNPAQPVVLESSRTGLVGACVDCEILDKENILTASTTDFARIRVPVGAVGSASVSVKNGVVDYGAGSVVGFTIRDVRTIVGLDLLDALTVTTYLNGVQQESSATNTLLNLQLLIPIIGNGTEDDIYNVGFTTTLSFDEVRLSVSPLVGVLNGVDVYGAFVTPFAEGCSSPLLTFNDIIDQAYVGYEYVTGSPEVSVATYSETGQTYSTRSGTGFEMLPTGLEIDPVTGVISGKPTGPIGLYTFVAEVRVGGTLIGQRTYQINVNSSLPVTLISFTAVKEGKTALLSWATSEETNSDRFDIERSQNGKTWVTIASKKSAGESKVDRAYSFTDVKPLAGVNYYRLKMVDLDRTFTHSRIESVSFGSEAAASVYPNPVGAADLLYLNVQDWNTVRSVKVINTSGKVVYENAGAVSDKISTKNMSAGLYFVQIIHSNGLTTTYKFAK